MLVSIGSCDDKVRVSVRDHGAGIPESFRPHVFEKFAQADATAARPNGGSGLGLSIVKQIVLRLEGEVGFLDAPGGGTIFYLELPGLESADHRDVAHLNGANGACTSRDDDDTASTDHDRLRLAAGAQRAFARTGTA